MGGRPQILGGEAEGLAGEKGLCGTGRFSGAEPQWGDGTSWAEV